MASEVKLVPNDPGSKLGVGTCFFLLILNGAFFLFSPEHGMHGAFFFFLRALMS